MTGLKRKRQDEVVDEYSRCRSVCKQILTTGQKVYRVVEEKLDKYGIFKIRCFETTVKTEEEMNKLELIRDSEDLGEIREEAETKDNVDVTSITAETIEDKDETGEEDQTREDNDETGEEDETREDKDETGEEDETGDDKDETGEEDETSEDETNEVDDPVRKNVSQTMKKAIEALEMAKLAIQNALLAARKVELAMKG